jgi:hypothetical protein
VSYGQSYVRRSLFDFSERAMTAILDAGQGEDVVALLLDKIATLHASGGDAKTIEAVGQWSRVASASLSRYGTRQLTMERSWQDIRSGAYAMVAGATLFAAARTLETARSSTIPRIRQDLAGLGEASLITALDLARRGALARVELEHPTEDKATSAAPAGHKNFEAMNNIAAYHREHERFYTVYKLEQAVELAQDSNRLKILADVWLSNEVKAPKYGNTDFNDPSFKPAGCDDLNAISSIASIGILFMEGQGEPAEIRVLKAKLAARGAGSIQSGQWLADMMVAAWSRESVLIADDTVDAVLPRYQTIATNWTGANETIVIGRLLALANECLGKINFTPAAIRANRKLSGNYLLTAARILEMAMRLQAKSGVDLSGNDANWTEYRAQIAPLLAKAK